MKKKLLLILSVLFVVSCASNVVDDSKLASEDAKEEAKKESKSSKNNANCQVNTMGSRLRRC